MSLTKVINTGIKNAEITGSKINTSSSFSFDILQANTLTVANDLQSNTINLIFDTANSSGVYANAAFNFANTISGGSAIDNVARTSANSASSYANSGFSKANTANVLAQSAFDAANNAVDSFVRDAANSASSYANSAFLQANTPSQVANAAFTAANVADQRAVTSGVYANAAYTQANLKFNSSGGLISGDVTISGNIIPTTDVTYNIGNSSNRIHTIFVGPGSIDIDGIILSNNNGQLTVSGALDFLVQGFPTTSNISDKINLVFDKANSAHLQANTPSQTSNSASSYANAAFTSSNVADQKAVSSGVYANSAYLQANTPSQVANSASSYANSAYTEANTRATISYVDNAVANLINSAPATLDTLNELATALNNDPNFATTVATNIGIIGVYANAAYTQANTPSQVANAAFTAANVADQRAVTSGVYANAAYTQANTSYLPSVTRLSVTNNSASAYLLDQYSGNNPTIYVTAGETISFNLNVSGHPFVIRTSSGGSNYDNGLTHVSTTGTVLTGSAAQGQVTGTLYWKVPFEIVGSTYVYQCTIHGGMVGSIRIGEPNALITTQTVAAFNQANTANILAQSAFNVANNAVDNVARTIANSASSYANGAFAGANTANTLAQSAFDAANNAVDSFVRDAANSASSYANSGFGVANTANTLAQAAYDQANSASVGTDDYARDTANSASLYANAAYDFANTISGGSAIDNVARTSANSASSYANSAFLQANTPSQVANAASSYANGAFVAANTADQRAVTSGVYANSAFLQANTPSQVANAASSYANGAFAGANTANTLAQAAYDQANTGGGGGGSGLFNPLINVATGYGVTSSLANAVVFSANAIVHSIYLTNISNVSTSNIQVTGDFTPSGSSNVSIFHKIPLPFRSSVEMLKKPQIVKTNDILKLQSFNNDVGVSANAYAIIVYETTTETSYERVGKLVTDAYSNIYIPTSNPSVVESIKLVNQDSTYGNHAVTVVWTNSANTLQGYLTKELILPANSTIELCETPKYMNAGDKFDAWATTTNVISIFVSAKKII